MPRAGGDEPRSPIRRDSRRRAPAGDGGGHRADAGKREKIRQRRGGGAAQGHGEARERGRRCGRYPAARRAARRSDASDVRGGADPQGARGICARRTRDGRRGAGGAHGRRGSPDGRRCGKHQADHAGGYAAGAAGDFETGRPKGGKAHGADRSWLRRASADGGSQADSLRGGDSLYAGAFGAQRRGRGAARADGRAARRGGAGRHRPPLSGYRPGVQGRGFRQAARSCRGAAGGEGLCR